MSKMRTSTPPSDQEASLRYLAVKVDVVGSRRSQDRGALQERLFATANSVNQRFQGDIASRFIVTHGDEVQGMLHWEGRRALLACLEAWVDGLVPHRVRFGVGAGGLSTPVRPEAIGMDGEAWHLANDAIQDARDGRKHVVAKGLSPGSDQALTALANLLLTVRYGWTAKQANAVKHVLQARTQAEAAHQLGIAAATLSRHLSLAHWDAYQEGRDAFHALLERA